MEQYKINNSSSAAIQFGRFYNKVHAKHIEAYSETGANNIVTNVKDTYLNIQEQYFYSDSISRAIQKWAIDFSEKVRHVKGRLSIQFESD